MGWQDDIRMTDAAVRKSAAASNAAASDRARRKIWKKKGDRDYNERLDVKLGNRFREEANKFGNTVGTMAEGLDSFFKPPSLMAMDAVTNAWAEGQEARRDDGKWTLGGDELDISRGTPAFKYLLDNVIQPEYRDDFKREVGKDNLHWTELNKYAGDRAAGLAPRINLLNDPTRFEDYNSVQQANYLGSILDPNWNNTSQEDAYRRLGIENTGEGRKLLNEYINAGVAMEGQGFIADRAREYANTAKEPIGLYPGKYSDTAEEPIGLYPGKYRDTVENNWIPKIKPKPPFLSDESIYSDESISLAPEYNAASMYPNLSMAMFRNKSFPGMALEDITQEDIDNAIRMGNTGFMNSDQLNQLHPLYR